MKVLFVCEGNMMRSQIAELFYNSITDTRDAASAGAIATLDKHMSVRGSQALEEIGMDPKAQYSKQLTLEMIENADKVILFPTDYMPEYTVSSKAEVWDVADPHYNKEKGMDFVRQVRNDIQSRVEKMIKETS